MIDKIDFVIPWVDGNDPKWREELNKYVPKNKLLNTEDRFRDWDNLQYIFRAFEQFTPWVNKIYFITWGHLPKWLNVNHPKLVIVKHEDYIDKKYLPIFSSHPLEINLHKISDLSEKFVYFNDDTFILKPLKSTDFFKNNLPVDMAISDIMHEGLIKHIVMNDIDIINKNFNRHVGEKLTKRGIIKKNFFKWFHPNYGKECFSTLILLYWKTFTGFKNYHQSQSFLKSTFEDVWSKEKEILEKTSSSKFRVDKDINQYLFRYWQLASGKFYPAKASKFIKQRKYIEVRTLGDFKNATRDMLSNKYEMYCLNDATSKGRYTKKDMSKEDFEVAKEILNNTFEKILPRKSKFENE
jgi:hypothetical protein